MLLLDISVLPYVLVLLPYSITHSFNPQDENVTTLAINAGVRYRPGQARIKLQRNYQWHLPTSYYTSNFSQFITESHMFADKSLWIKAVMEDPHRTIVITAPSRWGKTINLQMLKTFLEIQVDTTGRVIPLHESDNHRLFKYGRINENRTLREPLLISKYERLFAEHQGKWPVIYMDVNCFDVTNIVLFRYTLRVQMGDAYKEHAYMLTVLERVINSNASTEQQKTEAANDREKFFRYMYWNSTTDDLLFSVKFLSKLLYKHYNRKVIVLMDDYDQVLTNLALELHSESTTESSLEERDKMIAFFHNFLARSFRNNAFVEKSVLTGATSVAKDIPGDILGEFVDYNMFTNPLYRFFGYNQHEIDLICDHLKLPEEQHTLMDRWWNGIKVHLPSPITIYNMNSVNIFLREGRLEHYAEGLVLIIQFVMPEWMKMPYFEEAWHVLVSGNTYTIPLRTFEFTNTELNYIYQTMERSMTDYDFFFEGGPEGCYHTLHYFLVNGIVTLVDYKVDPDSPNITLATLQVPNIQNSYFLGNISVGHYSHHRFHMLNKRVYFLCRKLAAQFDLFMLVPANRSDVFELFYNDVYSEIYPQFAVFEERKLPYKIRQVPIPTPGYNSNETWIQSFVYLTLSSTHTFTLHRWPHSRKLIKPAIVATRDNNALLVVADSEHEHSLMPAHEPIQRFINVTAYVELFNSTYDTRHIENLKVILVRELPDKTFVISGQREPINSPKLPD